MSQILNPKPFLTSLLGLPVCIRLKWGMSYTGILASIDSYMNIHLTSATEYVGREKAGGVGEVLIRCNNVMYVKEGEGLYDEEEAGGE